MQCLLWLRVCSFANLCSFPIHEVVDQQRPGLALIVVAQVRQRLLAEAQEPLPLVHRQRLVFFLILNELQERLEMRRVGHHYLQHLRGGLDVQCLLPGLCAAEGESVFEELAKHDRLLDLHLERREALAEFLDAGAVHATHAVPPLNRGEVSHLCRVHFEGKHQQPHIGGSHVYICTELLHAFGADKLRIIRLTVLLEKRVDSFHVLSRLGGRAADPTAFRSPTHLLKTAVPLRSNCACFSSSTGALVTPTHPSTHTLDYNLRVDVKTFAYVMLQKLLYGCSTF
mmetsp:Transcript_38558/g.64875  ORF Transcript_38558/g.64875 Transcript_38558/m.64875 type:complete len:284 (+) Transcript_38558:403-1254(+)